MWTVKKPFGTTYHDMMSFAIAGGKVTHVRSRLAHGAMKVTTTKRSHAKIAKSYSKAHIKPELR